MKKELLVILLLLCFVSISNAQNSKLTVGIIGEANTMNYSLVDEYYGVGFSGKTYFAGGILAELQISEKIKVRLGTIYSAKKYFINSQGSHPDFNRLLSVNKYIETPISISLVLLSKKDTELFVSLGLVPSKKIHEYYSLSDSFFGYNDFLLRSWTGIGINQRLNERISLQIEPNIGFYLNEVHEFHVEENPIHFGIQLGVLYSFNKKL